MTFVSPTRVYLEQRWLTGGLRALPSTFIITSASPSTALISHSLMYGEEWGDRCSGGGSALAIRKVGARAAS